MGQKTLVASILLLSLFVIAVISYVIGYGNENRADVNLADDSSFEKLKLETKGNITTFKENLNESSYAFTQSTIAADSDTLSSPSVFQMLFFIPKTIFSVVDIGFKKIFGEDSQFSIIFITISTFVVFLGVIYIWKTFRGDPD